MKSELSRQLDRLEVPFPRVLAVLLSQVPSSVRKATQHGTLVDSISKGSRSYGARHEVAGSLSWTQFCDPSCTASGLFLKPSESSDNPCTPLHGASSKLAPSGSPLWSIPAACRGLDSCQQYGPIFSIWLQSHIPRRSLKMTWVIIPKSRTTQVRSIYPKT